MNEAIDTSAEAEPLSQRIFEFPLVAMILGIGLYLITVTVGILISTFAVWTVPGLTHVETIQLITIPLLILVYKLAIRRLGEHKRDDLRIGDGAFRLLGIGLAAGLLVFSVAVAVADVVGVYQITGEGDASGLAAAIVGSTLFPAVSEEMFFRGILFRWIEEFGGSWTALLLTSALFGALHLGNPHASVIVAVGMAFEVGIMLGAAYMLTRSLWLPMGIHAAWNFAQGEIYDIPVSGLPVHGLLTARLNGDPLLTGNGFGLEASLIAIVIGTLFGLWLLWLAIRRSELMAPWWVRRRTRA